MRKLLVIAAFLLFAGIAFGQTLQKGAVLAIRHSTDLVLKPDVSMNQFLDVMMNKWNPELKKLFPGTEVFVLKGDRGTMTNEYSWVFYFESEELRAKYFTPEGSLKDEAQGEKLQKLNEILLEYAIDTGMSDYTDWIVL